MIINTDYYSLFYRYLYSWIFMALLSVFILWFGCLIPYLASDKQQLIQKKISKHFDWSAFSVAIILAVMCLAPSLGYIVASLQILVIIMTIWTVLILMAAHLVKQFITVCTIGVVLFLLITLTEVSFIASVLIGEYYVA